MIRRPPRSTPFPTRRSSDLAECLRAGADVVVTGRVTDASLLVGPAIARFGWTRADLDALAGATVAGHIVECGALSGINTLKSRSDRKSTRLNSSHANISYAV